MSTEGNLSGGRAGSTRDRRLAAVVLAAIGLVAAGTVAPVGAAATGGQPAVGPAGTAVGADPGLAPRVVDGPLAARDGTGERDGVRSVSAAAASPVAGCTVIDQPGVYELSGDVATSLAPAETCVSINASNVTVDGGGNALTANGTGTGVGLARADLANVTVRNLAVANVSTGVDLSRSVDATVADVSVSPSRFGVDLTSTDRARVRNLTVTGEGGVGLFATGASDALATGLDVDGRFSTGLNVQSSSNVTVRGASFTRVVGVASAVRATEFTLRSATVTDSGAFPLVSFRSSTETSTVESGLIADVTLVDPRPALDGLARYVALDGSNTVQVVNLTTPNGTVGVEGANVTAVSVGPTPPAPTPATVAGSRINVTATGADASAVFQLRVPAAGAAPSTVGVYRVDRASDAWVRLPDANVSAGPSPTAVTANTSGGFGVYGVFAEPLTVDGCTVVNAAGVYTLTGDLAASLAPGDTCLTVNASDVTIDGAGRTLAGNGSGTAVGLARPGLANVTVRTLTVRNVSRGIDVSQSTTARVAGVTVRSVSETGVDARFTTEPTVTDTTILGDGSEGVQLIGADRPTLRNVTVDGGFFNGVGLASATNATVRSLVVRNASTGIYAFRATGLDVRTVELEGTRDPITVATAGTPQTDTVESGLVREVAVIGQPATYLKRLDGSNALRVETLTTPDGPFAAVNGTNVSLEPSRTRATTLAAPNLSVATTVARATVSGSPDGRLTVTVPYPASLNDSDVGLYRFDAATGNFSAAATLDGRPVTVDGAADTVSAGLTPGTYAVFEVTRTTADGPNGSLPLGDRLFPDGIPASSTRAPPTDVDGDGVLEDLDGDGRFRFVDVIEFVFSLQRGDYGGLSTAQTAALDVDGDGAVSFVDVIALVFEL